MKTILARLGAFAMGFALLGSAPAGAQTENLPARLAESGLSFEVDENGNYQLVIEFTKEQRSQLVIVSGTTETVQGMTIREIASPAALVKDHGIDGARALELLRESNSNKIGSWEIIGDALYMVVKVPEPLSAEDLNALILVVASVADDMEIELAGGTDDL